MIKSVGMAFGKIALVILCLGLAFFIAFAAKADTTKPRQQKHHKVTKKASPKAQNSQLGTSFSFDAASVRGKYQMAGQGIATVEDEKVLDDLLGLRLHFRDREQQEASRR